MTTKRKKGPVSGQPSASPTRLAGNLHATGGRHKHTRLVLVSHGSGAAAPRWNRFATRPTNNPSAARRSSWTNHDGPWLCVTALRPLCLYRGCEASATRPSKRCREASRGREPKSVVRCHLNPMSRSASVKSSPKKKVGSQENPLKMSRTPAERPVKKEPTTRSPASIVRSGRRRAECRA